MLFGYYLMNRLQNILLIVSILCLVALNSSFAQKKSDLTGKVSLGAETGMSFFTSDYKENKPGYNFRLSLGYNFDNKNIGIMGMKLSLAAVKVFAEDKNAAVPKISSSLYLIGTTIEYGTIIAGFHPYAAAGVNFLLFEPMTASGEKLNGNRLKQYNKTDLVYTAELGLKYYIQENLALFANYNLYFSSTDRLDDINLGGDKDRFSTVNIGISYLFGVVKDADKDGIPDDEDKCPDTPANIETDCFGCPADKDLDGVPDYLDKCTDTPYGARVDADGCPKDSDGDGVPDFIDKCPDTLPYTVVDERGCDKNALQARPYEVPQPEINKPVEENQILTETNDKGSKKNSAVGKNEGFLTVTSDESGRKINSEDYRQDKEIKISGNIFYDGSMYCLQHSAWKTKAKAEKVMKDLRLLGIDAFVVKAELKEKGGAWFRVRTGCFRSLEEARDFLYKYRSLF